MSETQIIILVTLLLIVAIILKIADNRIKYPANELPKASGTPHDTILISLPYPFRFLTFKRKSFRFLTSKRKIGFTFTNMAIFLFREHEDIKTTKEYSEWVEKHGQTGLISEMLYHAACAYCLQNKRKENFTKEGLKKAIALADQETQERILKVWRASETFGATVKQSKKKAQVRTSNMMTTNPK